MITTNYAKFNTLTVYFFVLITLGDNPMCKNNGFHTNSRPEYAIYP